MMEDYLSEKGTEMGKWGRGAAALGLKGIVKKEDFCRLTDGLHPQTGERLTQRARDDRRCYLGSVLSAPKSFSIVAIVGKDERLVSLFNVSVDETLEQVAQYAGVRVRAGGRDEDAQTGSLICARFTHPISRAEDPALHAHAPTFNATQTLNGEWKALQTTPIFERRKLFSEILLGKLAHGARQLGYETTQTKDGFEIAGISQSIIEMFSKGKKKIDDRMAELLETEGEKGHAAVRAIVAHQVRDAKREVTPEALQKKWQEEMGEVEHQKLLALVASTRERIPMSDRPMSPGEALRLAVSHLTERTSVVTDHQLLAEALAAGRGRVELTAVEAEMRRPDNGLIGGKGDSFGSRRLTTVELLEAEQRVLSFARAGCGQCVPLLTRLQRSARIRDAKLDQEQKDAVDKLLSSRDRVALFLGKAGTGKSTSSKDLLEGISTGRPCRSRLCPHVTAGRRA